MNVRNVVVSGQSGFRVKTQKADVLDDRSAKAFSAIIYTIRRRHYDCTKLTRMRMAPYLREEPFQSNFRSFCQGNSIVNVYTQIADGILDVRVA